MASGYLGGRCRAEAPGIPRDGPTAAANKFINQVKSQVTPGTSALFALTSGAVVDRVAEAFKGVQGQVISTNLSSEQEAQLREMFAEVAVAPKP